MIILGCGYIGTALARQALAAGEPVEALTRNTAKAEELRALGVAPVVVANLASADWHPLLNASDARIVNCVSPAGAGVEGYRHSFLEGAESIGRWLEDSVGQGRPPARELVFTSSTGVYPQTDGGWVDEATPMEWAALSSVGAVLREAEQKILNIPRGALHRAWILRLGGLYGPDRHQLLDSLRSGEKTFPGGGDHWVNLLHRDDAVGAIKVCLQASNEIPGGIFNAVDDEPVLKRELVTWLANQLGINVAEIQFTEGTSTRSAHRRGSSGKIPHRRIANLHLREVLGWRPLRRSYREGYASIMG